VSTLPSIIEEDVVEELARSAIAPVSQLVQNKGDRPSAEAIALGRRLVILEEARVRKKLFERSRKPPLTQKCSQELVGELCRWRCWKHRQKPVRLLGATSIGEPGWETSRAVVWCVIILNGWYVSRMTMC
jgi:hypothetical protein